jgi:mannose-6-phosphate isomerase-like protein (cupin superfamily)
MIKKERADGFEDHRGMLFWASPKILDFEYKYLTIGTLKPGYQRGNHYHKRIEEKLLVIEGELQYIERKVNTLSFKRTILRAGDIVFIPKYHVHTITNLTDEIAVFIEFKDEEYDINDTDTYND